VARQQLPPGGLEIGDPRWDPWHPAEVARLLARVDVPWYVAGGWALDLFRGSQTRQHADLEIGVPAPEFGPVREALAGYDLRVAGSGRLWPLDSPAFETMYQTWVSDPATGVFLLDIFREPQLGGTWVCRRDGTIRLPYQQIIRRTGNGIPYLVPEIVLLFKAKHAAQAKNQSDFDAALPLLDGRALGWLEQALLRVHPGHAWISAVAGRADAVTQRDGAARARTTRRVWPGRGGRSHEH
jgi:hypothetical protein